MDQIRVNSLSELNNLLEKYGEDVLFRGQITHYGDAKRPSITASFDRNGCVPSQMIKWCRYSQDVLEELIGEHVHEHHYVQALLQHYGWRSFYVDCSSSAAVSAWFASHKYMEDYRIELSEDCDEQPVLLQKRAAFYEFEEGEGHLYVIDKKVAGVVGLVDLRVLTFEGARPRTAAQAAWLLGPLRGGPVPQECFLAHIIVRRSVLRDYAFSHGLTETGVLFPPLSEDPLLKALLSLPWKEIEKTSNSVLDIPFFRRALTLPEYHDSFVKIAWPGTAFFRGSRILDTLDAIEGKHNGGQVIIVPEITLFGTASTSVPMLFPKLEALLHESGSVVFEIDEIVQQTRLGHLTLYQKGIGVIQRAEELYEVCELLVEHPGLILTRAGLAPGWYYRREINGIWVRKKHQDQCDCGNSKVHERHISTLKIIEAYLLNPESFKD